MLEEGQPWSMGLYRAAIAVTLLPVTDQQPQHHVHRGVSYRHRAMWRGADIARKQLSQQSCTTQLTTSLPPAAKTPSKSLPSHLHPAPPALSSRGTSTTILCYISFCLPSIRNSNSAPGITPQGGKHSGSNLKRVVQLLTDRSCSLIKH